MKTKLIFTIYEKPCIGEREQPNHWNTVCAFDNEDDAKEYIKNQKIIDEASDTYYDYKYHQTPFNYRVKS